MGERGYEIAVHSAAPPAVVFAVVADGPGWVRWTALGHASYEVEGTPAPHGVGAIRRLGAAFGPRSREQVVVYDPDHHFAYEALSGPLPMKDYRAEVRLTPAADGGTDISWIGSFRSGVPGMGWFIARMVRGFAEGLVAESERLAS
ncbi:MAG: SRPBCC family protein [Acidobacteria bacterium]|nr:SRPBCC family protein [Acidobacteriota bacterium]